MRTAGEEKDDDEVELAVDVDGRVNSEKKVQRELAMKRWTVVVQPLCSDRFWITAKLVEPVARTGGWMIRRPPRCGFARGN